MSTAGWVRTLVALCLLASVALLGAGESTAETFNDPGFVSDVVATLPPFTVVGLAWAPDGRLFVWQKNGVVRVIKQGVLLPTPFIDLSANVNTVDDRGFWGLAFHPDFANNGYVYMSYAYEPFGNPNDVNPRTTRLTRVTANPANPDVALPNTEVVILGSLGIPPCSQYPAGADCIPFDSGSHGLGNLQFAPDGTLFVGNGDGASADFADSAALGAQDITSYRGKILRIRDDGTAPSDNPFYDGTNSIRSKVWLYGIRNPFRFFLHPTTNEPWFGDVGWNTWEELNHGVKAKNFGWPCYEGVNPQPQYQSAFLQCRQLAANSVVAPVYTYDHTVGTALIGGPFYTGDTYPESYRGSFFFIDYGGNFIRRLTFDASGNPAGVVSFATSVAAPVTIEQGPDGNLYYLSFTTGQLRRIRFNGPSAVADATPSSGYSPLNVSFSSAGSTNAGGGPITFAWDFGDGGTSTAANPSHTYVSPGVATFSPKLTVSNQAGLTSTATLKVTVGSTPPVPTIVTPANNTMVQPGQTVSYQGSATDPDNGVLPASALTWTILLHHNAHVHTFIGATGAQGTFVVQDHGPIGTFSYEIILTATDSSGLQTSTSVLLPVGTVPDTTPPSTVSGLSAGAVNSSQINLSWTAATDNVGVTGYRVESCQGAGCSNFAQIATPAGTTFSNTGLVAGNSYSYRVRAVDAAGNLGGYSSVASATTPAPDITPPSTVSGLTATAAGTGQINLGWTAATDNVGVAGYRVERCSGAGCSNFAQVLTPTGTSVSDTGLAASTSYSYRVRAVDAAGNLGGYSNVASATTTAAQVTGLVAAYGFNEGSGPSVADASGNGNTGTISGATWTPSGRYGAALSFNGTSNLVVIPGSTSLNVSTAMTLSAWIQPTVAQGGWRTIMQREVNAYFLNASNDTGALRPAGGGTFNGGVNWVGGPTASPVSAWTHVALTYDGAMLRLYVNGVQAAALAQTGSIETPSTPLRIGGNVPYGEYFQGLIDEVRVYNRALSAAEIQSDMNTPIAP
jgi:glucose/arabinose dehydrogenase/chitodextrinase